MLRVRHQKVVPFPYDVVLSQYYDYEHIEHVHPETLGEYVLVSADAGKAVYEQIWPERRGRRRRSVVEQTFEPPNLVRFSFVDGRYKGVRVETRLEHHAEGTLVDETYGIPNLPDWGWLRRLAKPSVVRQVERVWQEDIDVEVCHGGWPGLPEPLADHEPTRGVAQMPAPRDWTVACTLEELRDGHAVRATLHGFDVALFRRGDEIFALENRCPHTGGPLALGATDDTSVICPWHGARFELASGACLSGPSPRGLARFATEVRGNEVLLRRRPPG